MLTLPVGILILVAAVFSIKIEPRRFFNAVSLMTALVFTVHGIVAWYQHFHPALETSGNGEFIITQAGEIGSILFFLLSLAIVVAGMILVMNGLILMKKESVCLAHALPILFGALCIALVVVYFVYIFCISGRTDMDTLAFLALHVSQDFN